MFSSICSDWRTPYDLFSLLDSEFHFTLDACASDDNHLCSNFFTLEDDSLLCTWTGSVWCNPPYSRYLGRWVEKAYNSSCDVVVMLLPARTDTKWFHDYILPYFEIRFLKGRLKFSDSFSSAPFPSMVCILDRR